MLGYASAAPEDIFVADPRRFVLGLVAAPVGAALAAEIPTFSFQDFWTLLLIGLMSVVTLYLPLMLWRLPRTKHPFLTCVLLGGVSAPGIVGYAFTIVGALVVEGSAAMSLVVPLATAPLGLIGGAVFWVCVVWRDGQLDRPSPAPGKPPAAGDGVSQPNN